MQRYAKRTLFALAAAFCCAAGNAQEAATAQPEETRAKEGQGPTGGLPLPDGDAMNVPINTIERFSVAPYRLFGPPRSTREEVATVTLVRPPGDPPTQLADSFTITTFELVGATTIVLPLVKEGEAPFERRIELLVIDSISTAYKSYLEATIRRMFPTATVDILIANQQTAVINGFVDRAELVQPIEDLVRGFLAAGAGSTPDSVSVVNAMRVTGVQQVQLQVVIAEVNRQKQRDLGFDWQWLDLNPNGLRGALANTTGDLFPRNAAQLSQLFPALTPAGGGTINFPNPQLAGANVPFVAFRGNNFAFWGFLRALIQNDMAKILAEPNLVSLSGQPAYFNVGGETPILIPQGNGTISIQYRPFGTNLRFVPTVLGDGRIRLEIRPEVSEIDPALAVTLNGINVPGFRSRTAETTIEMENGQTFAIAGLVQQRIQAFANKTPIMGDLPLVGWAFQNKQYLQLDTELLIMVTPHLAEPMNERPCKLPGRESRIPNDLEFFLGSKFEPPCFEDPYKNHYKNHFDKVKPPHPVANTPYDNYGKPEYDMMPVPADARMLPTETPAPPAPPAPADTLEAAPAAPAAPAPVPTAPAPNAYLEPPVEPGAGDLDEGAGEVVPPPPPVTSRSGGTGANGGANGGAAKIVSVQSSGSEGKQGPADDGWVRANRRRGGGLRQVSHQEPQR